MIPQKPILRDIVDMVRYKSLSNTTCSKPDIRVKSSSIYSHSLTMGTSPPRVVRDSGAEYQTML
jgi:hypothetical protein